MTDVEIVTDPFLRSALEASTATRTQCLQLIDNALGIEGGPGDELGAQQTELSRQRKLLSAHLSQLRGMARNAVFSVRQTKQDTAEARSEIDTLHLQLQNLYYEQRHLRGEIAACESYNHKFQSLPLISVEQFLETHSELVDADDENALMIARIEHERSEREALESARQELLKKKQNLIAENKKRKDDLASLDNDLEKFIDAAKPIQKLFEKEY